MKGHNQQNDKATYEKGENENQISDKGLIFRICKELQLNNKNTQITSLKNGQRI